MPLSNVVFPSLSKRHGGFALVTVMIDGRSAFESGIKVRPERSSAGAGPIVVAAPEVTNLVFWKISSGAVVLICGMRIEYL